MVLRGQHASDVSHAGRALQCEWPRPAHGPRAVLVEVLAVACGIALFAARAAPPTLAAMSTLPALRAQLALAPSTNVFTGKALEATHGAMGAIPLVTDTDPTARPVPAIAAAFAYTWLEAAVHLAGCLGAACHVAAGLACWHRHGARGHIHRADRRNCLLGEAESFRWHRLARSSRVEASCPGGRLFMGPDLGSEPMRSAAPPQLAGPSGPKPPALHSTTTPKPWTARPPPVQT